MSIDKLTSEILRLDNRDRAVLAEIIWESLEDPYISSEEMSDREAIDLSIKRHNEIEQGVVKPISHKELMCSLRNES